MQDPFKVLAVPRGATQEEIKERFRQLAKQLHPDGKNDPKGAALFAELIAAHEILANRNKRRAFVRGEIDAEDKPKREPVMQDEVTPIAYRPPQVARLLNVNLRTVFKWLKSGKLPSSKVGGTTLVMREQIDQMLTNHRV